MLFVGIRPQPAVGHHAVDASVVTRRRSSFASSSLPGVSDRSRQGPPLDLLSPARQLVTVTVPAPRPGGPTWQSSSTRRTSSLDGVVEHPETWPATGGFGVEGNKIQTDLVRACSAVVMGRRTYEAFADVWPSMAGDELADKMNAMPKYVASSTLTDPTWNNTHVIEGDPVERVGRLKREADGDIVQFGFGDLSRALLSAGLIDRLRLWLHPFFIGRGGPADLLYRDSPITRFDLDSATPLETGIVILDYRIRREGH